MSTEHIPFGKIIRTFKNAGAVKVKFYNPDSALIRPGTTLKARRVMLTIDEARRDGMMHIVRFREVTAKPVAEAISGSELEVQRDLLEAPGDDEYYLFELEGMSVHGADGALLGRVTGYHEGGVVVVEVKGADGSEFQVPLTPDFLIELHRADHRLIINMPEYEQVT